MGRGGPAPLPCRIYSKRLRGGATHATGRSLTTAALTARAKPTCGRLLRVHGRRTALHVAHVARRLRTAGVGARATVDVHVGPMVVELPQG